MAPEATVSFGKGKDNQSGQFEISIQEELGK